MAKGTVVLAFSGGLDTSAIIPWLRKEKGLDVIAWCANIGKVGDEEQIAARAKELGAVDFFFEDLRNTFAKDYVFPMLRAQAYYQDDYLLGTAIARPLIADRLAALARKVSAKYVAHGATGKGNDGIRFEKSLAYLAPELTPIAPWREWDFTGRADLENYLTQLGFRYEFSKNRYSTDENLLHRSTEGNVLEDIDQAYDPADVIGSWKEISSMPKPVSLNLRFEKGYVTHLDGKAFAPEDLIETLNGIGASHGIGVVDLVESRANGIKSRGIYETPGGTLLAFATKQLKHACWDRKLLDLSRTMGFALGQLIYDGDWFSAASRAAQAYFDRSSESLTGTVRLKLVNGRILVEGRDSPFQIYDKGLVSFAQDVEGVNKAAEGYYRTIKLSANKEGRQFARLQGKD